MRKQVKERRKRERGKKRMSVSWSKYYKRSEKKREKKNCWEDVKFGYSFALRAHAKNCH